MDPCRLLRTLDELAASAARYIAYVRKTLIEEIDVKNPSGEVVTFKVADISHVDAKDFMGSWELWITTHDGQLLIFHCQSRAHCTDAVERIAKAVAEYWASSYS